MDAPATAGHHGGAEDGKGGLAATESGRTALGATRSPEALAAFQRAAAEIVAQVRPDVIAIKEKSENGRMRGGTAAFTAKEPIEHPVVGRAD